MKLPERQPVQEAFSGHIYVLEEQGLLASEPLADRAPLYRGAMLLRYGVEYLGKPQFCIMPELVAMDYGAALAGEEAWQFLFERSNLYPRADVVGYRNDGLDDMVVVKWLDLMAPVAVVAYASESDHVPIAWVRGFIGAGFDTLPNYAKSYLPYFENVESWQATLHE
ncbi:MAG: hypothetical protein KC615_06525 [Anaerolineae bacterium]|nr:hypothetical protein [Anaerolineae bacterium]